MTVKIKSSEIYLDKLNEIESATLLAVNSRPLKKNEITDEETDDSLLSLLSKTEGLKTCKGNPKRLIRFAKNLKKENFNDIE